MAVNWQVSREAGSATDLHQRSAELVSAERPRRSVRLLEASAPAVILGSAQPAGDIDEAVAASAGVAVVRRRSGGGAVLVTAGSVLWVDLVLPAADPLWEGDVGRAAHWVGRAWAAALAEQGVAGVEVWEGPMRRTPWSGRVCFAGVGPGEVLVGGTKLVGVSQRRTRRAALFQTAVLIHWEPDALVDLLALEPGDRARATDELAGVAAGCGEQVAAGLFPALVDSLPA